MMIETSVHDLTQDSLAEELSYLARYLGESGHDRCKAMFGWHWGMEYYPDNRWESYIALTDLEAEVRRVEESGLGRMGCDDLYVSIPSLDWEFRFCHHAGIHIKFSKSGPVAEHFLNRWREAGWSPVERTGQGGH